MSILETPKNDDYIFINFKIGKNAHVSNVIQGVIYVEPNYTWEGMNNEIALKENDELRDMRRIINLSKLNKFYFKDINIDIRFTSHIGTNLKGLIIETNKNVRIIIANSVRSSLRNFTLKCQGLSINKNANSPDIQFINIHINCNMIVLNDFSNYKTIVVGESSNINANGAIIKKPIIFEKPKTMKELGYGFIKGVKRMFVHVSKSFGVLVSDTSDIPTQQAISATQLVDGKYCTECQNSIEMEKWLLNQ